MSLSTSKLTMSIERPKYFESIVDYREEKIDTPRFIRFERVEVTPDSYENYKTDRQDHTGWEISKEMGEVNEVLYNEKSRLGITTGQVKELVTLIALIRTYLNFENTKIDRVLVERIDFVDEGDYTIYVVFEIASPIHRSQLVSLEKSVYRYIYMTTKVSYKKDLRDWITIRLRGKMNNEGKIEGNALVIPIT